MAKAAQETKPENGMGTILLAISNVSGQVGAVMKAGHNEFHNYNYATAADVMGKLQPLLVQEGLVIIPSEVSKEVMADCVLAVTYEFTIGHKSGAVWPDKPKFTGMSAILNQRGVADDKAGNKTLTAASKYFAINLFKIPTREAEADADGDVPRVAQGSKATVVISPPPPARPAPEPPRDASGSLLPPSRIAPPGEKDGSPSWIDWGATFIAAITTALTTEDVARWEIENSKALMEMNKAAPKAKARLMQRVMEQRKRVADALIDSLGHAMAACDDTKQLDQLWAGNNEHLASLSKQDRDRAAEVYESHRNRFKPNPLAA